MRCKLLCIFFSGKPLTDAARDSIMRTSVTLVKNKKNRVDFIHDDVAGTITTEYESSSLAGSTGIVFHAEISTKKGKTSADYLIREPDLIDFDEDHERFWLSEEKQEAYKWN